MGKIKLIARQRQLRKHENLGMAFCCSLYEANVVRNVGVDITP